MTQEERLIYSLEWIKKITSDQGTLNTSRAEAEKYYLGSPLGNEKKGRSQIVMTDLSDTIEWVMPSLMRIFCGGDDVCQIQPRGSEDIAAADSNNELINYQLRIRNKWFLVLHDFFKDALLQKTGIIKYSWIDDKATFDKDYEGITLTELMAKLMDSPNTEITTQKKNPDGSMDVTLTTTIEDEYPLIECVPPYEVGFPNDTRDMDVCPFIYHRVKLYPFEIDKRFGKGKAAEIKDKVNTISSSASDTMDTDTIVWEKFQDLGGLNFIFSEADGKYWIYECYFFDPDSGESRKFVMAGDVVLEDVKNRYGRPPFHIITPIKLTHRVIGRSMHDLTRDLQRLHTALIRQVLDNLYFTNNGRWIGDPDRVNVDDVLNNNVPGGFVRGDPTAIAPLTVPQLQPWTFKFIEMVQTDKENRTGFTRYTQGLDANSLNKTARGLTAILQQSQQRLELMARLFAEMGIAPLVNSVLEMNQKFLKNSIALRVRGDWIEINPDNIIGKWDIIVDVGIGTGNKDQIIAQMQQLLGIYGQLYKAGIQGIITPTNLYNACKELVKAMGYRNVDDFFTKPVDQGGIMPMQPQPQPVGPQEPNEQVANGGTMLNQTTPSIPFQPAQAGQPTLTPDGNGFYG